MSSFLSRRDAVRLMSAAGAGLICDPLSFSAGKAWAADFEITNWAQFFLKYILSHPAVTCVIPGTSDPVHVVENMEAAYGKLPDDPARKKMAGLMA